jgi:hypothetical protein
VNTPECLAFTQTHGEDELIIGLRDTSYLMYYNCISAIETKVSLNENEWDTHCSFTPLYLDISPDRSLLLVASDKHVHYIMKMKSNWRVATLAGHSCSDYGKPRTAWDLTGKYIYSNSEHDNQLHIYSLASKKVCVKKYNEMILVCYIQYMSRLCIHCRVMALCSRISLVARLEMLSLALLTSPSSYGHRNEVCRKEFVAGKYVVHV